MILKIPETTIPLAKEFSKTKKGTTNDFLELTFHNTSEILKHGTPQNKAQSFGHLKTSFETHFEDFELFWYSKPIAGLRDSGLLVL